MRLPITAMIRRLLCADRNSLLLAGFNLVAGIVITTLLVFAARDTAYPPAVGLALALFVGGGLTGLTVWASLWFAWDGRPEDARDGKDSALQRWLGFVSVDPDTRHFQAQAVTLLAIATGAIGFGLFGAEFRLSMEPLPALKFAAGGLALVIYMALVESVRVILRNGDVTGRQVAQGPLKRMFLVVVYVMSVFVIGIFDSPPPA